MALRQHSIINVNDQLEHTSDVVFLFKDDVLHDCNIAAVKLLGLTSKQQLVNAKPWHFAPRHQIDGMTSKQKAKQKLNACLLYGQQRFLWLYQGVDKALHWFDVVLSKINYGGYTCVQARVRVANHTFVKFGSTSELVESQLEADNYYYQLLAQHKAIIDASAIVSKTDKLGIISYVNNNFCQISGYRSDELIGRRHSIVNHSDMPKHVFKELWQTINRGNIWQGVIKNRKKDGSYYIVKTTIAPIFDKSGEITEFISMRDDITDLYRKDKTIERQNKDLNSGLFNSYKLRQDLEQGHSCHLAVFQASDLVDIQNAYDISEYQQVLAEFARLLVINLPNDYKIYRFNETLFVVMTEGSTFFNLFVKHCRLLQTKLEQVEFQTQENSFSLNLTAGLSQWQKNRDLLACARMALASAEESHQKLVVFTSENSIHSRLINTIDWTKKLKQALSSDGIMIFGQHIYDRRFNKRSTEVLMRYYEPVSQSYVSPIEFLPSAKKAKIYPLLTQVVVNKAFEYFSGNNECFSINLSKADILDDETVRLIINGVVQYRIAHRVTFELVESENYDLDDQQFLSFLLKLRALGCRIAIDDFGSGYSNFEYLTRLPIDVIKIDGSLIKQIANNRKHQIVVKTIVNFCRELEVDVVAEYVANEAILSQVKKLDIDLLQGYYFHQPQALIC